MVQTPTYLHRLPLKFYLTLGSCKLEVTFTLAYKVSQVHQFLVEKSSIVGQRFCRKLYVVNLFGINSL